MTTRFTPPGGAEPTSARELREALEQALGGDLGPELERNMVLYEEVEREYGDKPRSELLELLAAQRAMMWSLKDASDRKSDMLAKAHRRIARLEAERPRSRKRSA